MHFHTNKHTFIHTYTLSYTPIDISIHTGKHNHMPGHLHPKAHTLTYSRTLFHSLSLTHTRIQSDPYFTRHFLLNAKSCFLSHCFLAWRSPQKPQNLGFEVQVPAMKFEVNFGEFYYHFIWTLIDRFDFNYNSRNGFIYPEMSQEKYL